MQHGGGDIAKMSSCESSISLLEVIFHILFLQEWKQRSRKYPPIIGERRGLLSKPVIFPILLNGDSPKCVDYSNRRRTGSETEYNMWRRIADNSMGKLKAVFGVFVVGDGF